MRKCKGLFMNDWEWQSQIYKARVVANHVEEIMLHLRLQSLFFFKVTSCGLLFIECLAERAVPF